MSHATLTTFLTGRFVIYELGFVMVNVSAKLEISISTHHEYTKGDTKCREWGGLMQLGGTLLCVTFKHTVFLR